MVEVIDLTVEPREERSAEARQLEHGRRTAVLLPCHNEAPTIGGVVRNFRRALPHADIYVYDNASTDGTAEIAAAAGATVRHVPSRGKGRVLRRMFADVEATVYIVADGDGTYDADDAPRLVERLRSHNLEMVIGRRVEVDDVGTAYRRGHRLGNRLLSTSVHWLFGEGPEDMLSGYRAFSRRFVKSFPAVSHGFEAETEMTVHALDVCASFEEIPVNYCGRPVTSSKSKLRTIRDGLCILRLILRLYKEYRPLRFFGVLASLCLLGALATATVRAELPTSATPGVSLAFVCFGGLFFVGGLVIDSVSRARREVKRALFLAVPQVEPKARSKEAPR